MEDEKTKVLSQLEIETNKLTKLNNELENTTVHERDLLANNNDKTKQIVSHKVIKSEKD